MQTRSDSIRRHVIVPPFKHPHFQTFRDMQREAFALEIQASMQRDDAMRDRLAMCRVLESVQ